MIAYYDQIYDFSEEDWYDALRLVLPPTYMTATEDELDDALENLLVGMSPETAENFLSSLGKIAKGIGRGLVQIAPTVLPMVGGAVGTLIAPGVGTAIGTQLGGLAGGLIRQTATPRSPSPTTRIPEIPNATPSMGMPPMATPGIINRGASSNRGGMTGQLLQLLNNPQMLTSLMTLLTGGGVRRESILTPQGAYEVTLVDLLNALSVAAEQVSSELTAYEMNMDFLTETNLDIASPTARATTVFNYLQQSETYIEHPLEMDWD